MGKGVKLECAKCGDKMREGWLLDSSIGGNLPVKLVEGHPEPLGFWSFGDGDMTLKGKAQYRITAYRCSHCGYVEFYAREKAA